MSAVGLPNRKKYYPEVKEWETQKINYKNGLQSNQSTTINFWHEVNNPQLIMKHILDV